MRTERPITSRMGWSTPDKIFVQGYDLCADLLGKIDLGSMAFLEIRGRNPSPAEAEIFNAVLVTLVEHGMTPQAMASRLVYLAAPEALQGAVAAGLLGVGSVFGGGAEATAQMLQTRLPKASADGDLAALGAAIAEDHLAQRVPVPGLGHPLHKPVDPRAEALFAIADRNGYRGRYVALFEAVRDAAEHRTGKALPINAPGAIGALLSELGFDWQICRGVSVISRCVGLVGHIAEELRNPIARSLWQRAEREVLQNVDGGS